MTLGLGPTRILSSLSGYWLKLAKSKRIQSGSRLSVRLRVARERGERELLRGD